jgi:hypothetical protein
MKADSLLLSQAEDARTKADARAAYRSHVADHATFGISESPMQGRSGAMTVNLSLSLSISGRHIREVCANFQRRRNLFDKPRRWALSAPAH